jgi:hypothetical protein
MGNDLDLAGSQDGCKDCQRQKTAISAILCNSTGNLMPKHLHRAGASSSCWRETCYLCRIAMCSTNAASTPERDSLAL